MASSQDLAVCLDLQKYTQNMVSKANNAAHPARDALSVHFNSTQDWILRFDSSFSRLMIVSHDSVGVRHAAF